MRIVVAYKWAPNPQDATVSSGGDVDWSRAKAAVSEYDAVAIELGRRLADATGGELVGVSIGGPDVAAPLARKAALSRGLDRVVAVADEALAGAGSTDTGLTLAALVRRVGDADVILAGDSSVDVGAQIVPAVLAAELGVPFIPDVTGITAEADGLTVQRSYRGGAQVLAVRGPAVLGAAGDAVEPRVPGMKDILAAGKKPFDEVALADLAPAVTTPIEVVERRRPELAARRGQVIDGSDPAAAAAELVAALRADGVL